MWLGREEIFLFMVCVWVCVALARRRRKEVRDFKCSRLHEKTSASSFWCYTINPSSQPRTHIRTENNGRAYITRCLFYTSLAAARIAPAAHVMFVYFLRFFSLTFCSRSPTWRDLHWLRSGRLPNQPQRVQRHCAKPVNKTAVVSHRTRNHHPALRRVQKCTIRT